MSEVVTNVTVAAGTDVRTSVHDFIYEHVMFHRADLDQWNIPFAHWAWLDIFRNDAFMLFFGLAVLVFIFARCYRRDQPVQRGIGNALEVLVEFIRNKIAIEFMGRNLGVQLAPLLCSLFFFILTMNLLGLVPVFSCATSNLNVTGALAAVTAVVMIGGSIRVSGWRGFLGTFVVPDVPRALQVLMVPIEVISVVSKIFALMIRLFANMLAGHIVIFSMLGIVVIVGWYALPMVAVAVVMFFFELFVGFFQAYIFTLLSAVFISQTLRPQH